MGTPTKGRTANSQFHPTDCGGKLISDLSHICTCVLKGPDALLHLFKARPPFGTKAHLGYRFKREQMDLKICKPNLALLRKHCDIISRPMQQLGNPGDRGNRCNAIGHRNLRKHLRVLIPIKRLAQGLSAHQPYQHQVKSPITSLSLVALQFGFFKRSALVGLALKSIGRHTDNPSSASGSYACNCSDPVRCAASLPRNPNALRRAKDNPAQNCTKHCADKCNQRRISLRDVILRNFHATPCSTFRNWGILA